MIEFRMSTVKKNIRQAKRNYEINKSCKSMFKNAKNKLLKHIEQKDSDIKSHYNNLLSILTRKLLNKGIINKRKKARIQSRLASKMKG